MFYFYSLLCNAFVHDEIQPLGWENCRCRAVFDEFSWIHGKSRKSVSAQSIINVIIYTGSRNVFSGRSMKYNATIIVTLFQPIRTDQNSST